MTVMRHAPAAAAAITLGLLLGSCGGDDGPTSPPPAGPPAPVVLELPPAPVFGSLDPVGLAVEDTVSALLAWIDTPAVMSTALAPAASLAWTADGACWTGRAVAGGPDFGACAIDQGWSWEVWAQPDSLLADGETDATGRSGDFRAYATPGVVAVAWTWAAAASRDSVEWTYARENEATVGLHWSRDHQDARLWLWTWPGERLIGYRISAARTTGWCETYDWLAGNWILRQEIAWDGGHGRRLSFNAAGQEIDREVW
jgi:hypothetical protein